MRAGCAPRRARRRPPPVTPRHCAASPRWSPRTRSWHGAVRWPTRWQPRCRALTTRPRRSCSPALTPAWTRCPPRCSRRRWHAAGMPATLTSRRWTLADTPALRRLATLVQPRDRALAARLAAAVLRAVAQSSHHQPGPVAVAQAPAGRVLARGLARACHRDRRPGTSRRRRHPSSSRPPLHHPGRCNHAHRHRCAPRAMRSHQRRWHGRGGCAAGRPPRRSLAVGPPARIKKVLQRRGVRFSLLDPEKLAARVITSMPRSSAGNCSEP